MGWPTSSSTRTPSSSSRPSGEVAPDAQGGGDSLPPSQREVGSHKYVKIVVLCSGLDTLMFASVLTHFTVQMTVVLSRVVNKFKSPKTSLGQIHASSSQDQLVKPFHMTCSCVGCMLGFKEVHATPQMSTK